MKPPHKKMVSSKREIVPVAMKNSMIAKAAILLFIFVHVMTFWIPCIVEHKSLTYHSQQLRIEIKIALTKIVLTLSALTMSVLTMSALTMNAEINFWYEQLFS
jgi:hypothetical protein